MRVLTVRQPWAWAIIHGGKDVENRSRNIAGSYRGPVAIQAGLAYVKNTKAGAVHRMLHGSETPTDLKFGAIIGVVDLTDVHRYSSLTKCYRPADVLGWVRFDGVPEPEPVTCSEWHLPEQHHLMLANPRPISPIPAKGRLGLWRPDPELQAQIEEAIR